MSVTNYMNLTLPTVSVTLGPDYATENNEAFEAIDAHDHTSGKGIPVPTSGLNINANLNFQSKKAYSLYSTQFVDQVVALTGASNARSVSSTDGDLYYTNSSGNSIQITSGGSLVAAPGATTALEVLAVNTNLTISAGSTAVVLLVDTTSSRTITLPLASTVAAGRIYTIKDASGLTNTNPMIIAVQGSDTVDGLTTDTMASNYGANMYIGDGALTWYKI